jgi:cytochrome c-type biogenesis protein CcmH/NrfF
MTQACVNWRGEIRTQLEAGRTEEQIVADFVARYGERASSTPLDPTLRGLSVYVPWLIAGVALVVGLFTLWRWQRVRRAVAPAAPPAVPSGPDEDYRAALERDVKR